MPDTPYILLVNGPELGKLGHREPEIYGTDTLEDIQNLIIENADNFSLGVRCFQSDSEGEIIAFLNEHGPTASGVIINPAILTHTSQPLFECLDSLECPIIEVHITNLYAREKFRHESVTAPATDGVIMGLGKMSYLCALISLVKLISDKKPPVDQGGNV